MNYDETLNYLYNSVPVFQHIGADAYKPGLQNVMILDESLQHPHRKYKTIHVGGTNGKGSTSHTVAAILQEAGYKVGLYTSPHLVDFRERIRVDGRMISKEFVVSFVNEHKAKFEEVQPSFFELTMMLAFTYFAAQKVDVAIIEVGLGGRLDSTNIINPDLSIITNISFDHIQFLGDTLEKIAAEKAGIIKPRTPIVIGETTPETQKIFEEKAAKEKAPIIFAEKDHILLDSKINADGSWSYYTSLYGTIKGQLGGLAQEKNTRTILSAIRVLQDLDYHITTEDVVAGFEHVIELTELKGRWQQLQCNPTVVCDTGHNIGGIQYIIQQLKQQTYKQLRIVIGMVNDKDISGVLALLPQDATYYFTKATIKRAMDEHEIQELGSKNGLVGTSYPSVDIAYQQALKDADPDDLIFVGGSSFIVADLLSYLEQTEQSKTAE
ncbi:MAG: bifunctional folylpolyglutamate synthase/dihydrofolate synthase [Tannerellaceae bacterium]